MNAERFLSILLLVLGISGAGMADISAGLMGLWEFDDAGNLTVATVGNDLILNGTGQSAIGGVNGSDGAVAVEAGTYYQCAHGIPINGGSASWVNEYTLLFDVMYPEASAGQWRAFYQTGYATYNDSDYFIHPSDESWGVAALGYTDSATVGEWYSSHSTWYRVVMTVNLDDNEAAAFYNMYINGALKGKHNTTNLVLDGRFSLYPSNHATPYVCFAGDNDGEDALMYFSNIAIWDRPLTAQEVAQLGGPGDPVIPLDPALASNPSPVDEESDACTNVILEWTPGAFVPPSNGHRVYLSENFGDVNDSAAGAIRGLTSSTEFETTSLPFVLEYEKTYYWRIDEANSVSGWDAGPVWSFTTEPMFYAIAADDIVATASSNDPGRGPGNTVDGSGLVDDMHSTDVSTMWLSGSEPTGAWIQYEFDKVYKLYEMWVWNFNGEGPLAWYGLKDVTIQYSADGTQYTTLGATHTFGKAPGASNYTHGTPVDFGGVAVRYVKIIANSNHSNGLLDQFGLSEVRFLYLPVQARLFEPEDKTGDVATDVILKWRSGREAATHEVYLSTDRRDVVDGSVSPVMLPDGVCRPEYGPLSLDLGRTYYWKVVEVNPAQTPDRWESDIVSFSTQEYVVVDDIDDYNDYDPYRVFDTWVDGWGIPANGSQVGEASFPYAESDIVRSGLSMPFYYDNRAPANYSEATASIADLQVGPDWTIAGIRALTLHVYGSVNNVGGGLYVKLNGSAPQALTADLTDESWQEVSVDLASFGANLQNVSSVIIGVDGVGSNGKIYIDDIRLYPSRCSLERRPAGFAEVDYVGDCRVDSKEVAVMGSNWLLTSAAPSAANLVGWWRLDGNANDSSAGGINGAVMGTEQWVTGKADGALEFDGRTHVVLGTTTDLNFGDSTDFTVALWVKTTGWQDDAALISNKDWNSGANTGWVIACQEGGDGSWQWNYKGATGPRRDYDPSGPELSDGQWHHLCVSHDRDGYATFYFDGEYQAQVNISGSTGTLDSTYPTVIGTDGAEGLYWPYWFEGAIDDVRIYKAVLSDSEVRHLSGIRGDLNKDAKVDFKDFAELGDAWLDEGLWP